MTACLPILLFPTDTYDDNDDQNGERSGGGSKSDGKEPVVRFPNILLEGGG